MSYSPQAVNAVGYVMMGLGMAGEVSVWLLGQVPGALPGPGGTAGTNAFWLGLAGLLTIVVNGIVSDRHNRRSAESGAARFAFEYDRKLVEAKQENDRKLDWIQEENDRKLVEAKVENDRKLAEAKVEADRKLAEAKVEADRKLVEARNEVDRRVAEARNEVDRRVAEAMEEADRKLVEAKVEADRRVARLEGRIAETDRSHTAGIAAAAAGIAANTAGIAANTAAILEVAVIPPNPAPDPS